MSENQTPDPDFVRLLEWDVRSAVRRQGAFNGASAALRLVRSRWATSVAMVVLSLFVGGAGTYAAIYKFSERDAALYIARGEALLEIARTRMEPLVQEFTRTQALVEQGMAFQQELEHAELAVVQAESEVQVRELDLDEIRLSGKEPNDSLSAPHVDGRDFVRERLLARLRPMQRRLNVLAAQFSRTKEQIDAGIMSERELASARLQVAQAEADMSEFEKRLDLRDSFVAGKRSAKAVELEAMRFAAQANRERAAQQVQALGREYSRLKQLSDSGMVSAGELRTVEAQLREAEASEQLAELELRIFEQKLAQAAAEDE